MTAKENFTFVHAYVVSKSNEPGGTLTIRTRALNKKYDVFAPLRGFDVMLPSGVVHDFENVTLDTGYSNLDCIGILTDTFEKNVLLRSRYDKEGALACNENRNEELFRDDDRTP